MGEDRRELRLRPGEPDRHGAGGVVEGDRARRARRGPVPIVEPGDPAGQQRPGGVLAGGDPQQRGGDVAGADRALLVFETGVALEPRTFPQAQGISETVRADLRQVGEQLRHEARRIGVRIPVDERVVDL
nr:hypothetical protein [Nannocystis exedens]